LSKTVVLNFYHGLTVLHYSSETIPRHNKDYPLFTVHVSRRHTCSSTHRSAECSIETFITLLGVRQVF